MGFFFLQNLNEVMVGGIRERRRAGEKKVHFLPLSPPSQTHFLTDLNRRGRCMGWDDPPPILSPPTPKQLSTCLAN